MIDAKRREISWFPINLIFRNTYVRFARSCIQSRKISPSTELVHLYEHVLDYIRCEKLSRRRKTKELTKDSSTSFGTVDGLIPFLTKNKNMSSDNGNSNEDYVPKNILLTGGA
eukprot:13499419-Ditylum_brightwellii.AAC.1